MLGLELCCLSVTPYLACKDAARAIEFYEQAFGAAEVMRMPAPGGKLGHAEIRIGDSRVHGGAAQARREGTEGHGLEPAVGE